MQLKKFLKQKRRCKRFKGGKKIIYCFIFIVFTTEQKQYSEGIAKRSQQHTTEAHENQHTHQESIYLGANAAGKVHSFN